MMGEITYDDLGTVAAPSLLDEARALRLGSAAERLREVQALAGVFAAMLEGRACSIDDLMNMDHLFTASCHRTGEALMTLGGSLSCEGIA